MKNDVNLIDNDILVVERDLERLKSRRESIIQDIKSSIYSGYEPVPFTRKLIAAISYLMKEEIHFYSKYDVKMIDDHIGFCYVDHYTYGGYPIRVGHKDNIRNANAIDTMVIWRKLVSTDKNMVQSAKQFKDDVISMDIDKVLELANNHYGKRLILINVPELELSDIFILLPEKHME